MPVSTTAHIQIDDHGVVWIDQTNIKVMEVILDVFTAQVDKTTRLEDLDLLD